jgi:hypothetical protein
MEKRRDNVAKISNDLLGCRFLKSNLSSRVFEKISMSRSRLMSATLASRPPFSLPSGLRPELRELTAEATTALGTEGRRSGFALSGDFVRYL